MYFALTNFRSKKFQLALVTTQKIGVIDTVFYMRIEIAIRTFRFAEWVVNVDG